MILRRSCGRRTAAVAVEAGFVYPVLFMLLFGLISGGLGVVHYQQVACQAHEASRYASVHGSDWAQATRQKTPTAAEIIQAVVLSRAVSMDPSQLDVKVQWINGVTGAVMDWDDSTRASTTPSVLGTPVANRVRVTVRYRWSPDLGVVGPITLESFSELPMAF